MWTACIRPAPAERPGEGFLMSDWIEAERRIERAQQLLESHRLEEALSELDAAIAINSNNAIWHAQRGSILEEIDRLEEAAEAYQRALDLEPGDRHMLLALGEVQLELGRYARAIKVFEQVAKEYPDFEPAYCYRIRAYAEIGQHERAEEMFYLAQQIDDKCPNCFFALGASLFSREQYDRALFCWNRVIELEPTYLGANEHIARAYRAKGDLSAAHEALIREVRNDPGNTDLLFELAEVTLQTGQIANAAAKFAQIIELDPEHAESHFALGRIWSGLARPDKAIACFEAVQSIVKDGDLPTEFHRYFGEAMMRAKRFPEARKLLELAAHKEPTDSGIAVLLGDCLFVDDRAAEAAQWYRKAVERDVRNPFAHHKLGLCLYRLSRFTAGLESCLEAVRLKSDYVPAFRSAAIGCLRASQWRKARHLLNEACRQEPENAELGKLRSRIWRFQARHILRRMLSAPARLFGSNRRPSA